jgi:hypothetical protein
MPHHNFILWLAMLGRLKTKDRLRPASSDNICYLCKQHDETHNHIFFACDWTSFFWRKVKSWLQINRSIATLNSVL